MSGGDRAKTSVTALRMRADAARVADLPRAGCEYLELAERLLHPRASCLMAIGGLSGSGKSTFALLLGAVPGALVLRSDEVRTEICGVPALERLRPNGYTTEISRRVYATLAVRAGIAGRHGYSAIVDAVFIEPSHRQAIKAVARASAIPFIGLWLDAREDTRIARLEKRANEVSDADAVVLRTQQAQDAGEIKWHTIDASQSSDVALEQALTLLRVYVNDAAGV